MTCVRAIAFYLPQFHPIPENDEWWGKGFTEWTNTAKAKPLFPGHLQPKVPADLGFYDLRVPETRKAQADLARLYGIEAFCYYHYWFGGRRILERPLEEVLKSGEPEFPFCLCWANETWSGIWHGAPNSILIEQTYPGEEDHRAHFKTLLPAFQDPRYVRIDGKPVFIVYKPEKLPDCANTIALWQTMAINAGLPGLHFVGMTAITNWSPAPNGFDAKIIQPLIYPTTWVSRSRPLAWLRWQFEKRRGGPHKLSHPKLLASHMPREIVEYEAYPCLIHAWDNTPRSGRRGVVLTGSTPALFRTLLKAAIKVLSGKPQEHRLLFLKSWNEWAEGNYLEPDISEGHAYLQVIKDEINTLM